MNKTLTKKLSLIILSSCLVLVIIPTAQTHAMNNDSGLNTKGSTLNIATRHDASLYNVFADAFLASDYASDAGVTSVNFKSPSTYNAFYQYMTRPDLGVSIGWGGGPTIFTNLALDDALMEISDETTDTELMALIDDAVPETIAGASMRFSDGGKLYWIANAISSFGFTVNLDYLNENGLPIPSTWDDLASPDFFKGEYQNVIAMGNAPQTTSITRIYQIIVQKYGWEKGWEIMTRMAGNGGIYGESVPTRSAVISKEVGIAMTIDFYGLIAQLENDRCFYIVPENGSIVNGDPIVIAKEAPNLPGAVAFLKFVNSQEGQSLWLNTDINRLPVRADAFNTTIGQTRDDIFDVYNMTIHNKGIDFDEELALTIENSLIFYFDAAITTPHVYLKREWTRLVEAYKAGDINETTFNAQAAVFGAPDLNQTEALEINEQIGTDSSFRNSKISEWVSLAKQRFGETVTSTTGTTTTAITDDTSFNMTEVAIMVFIPIIFAVIRKQKNRKR